MMIAPKYRRTGAVLYDALVCVIAFSAAHSVAFGLYRYQLLPQIVERTIAFEIICLLCIYVMRLNRGLWRYASIPDMVAIFKMASLAVLLYTVANFLISRGENISRSAMILTWLFIIFGMGAGRIIARFIKETRFQLLPGENAGDREWALLYPFSDTTEAYIRVTRRLAFDSPGRAVAGIVDSHDNYSQHDMLGVPVLGAAKDMVAIVAGRRRRGQDISELIVTDPSISGREMTRLLERCNKAGIGIKRLPDVLERRGGENGGLLDPNPVRLDDLLDRPEVKVDYAQVAGLISGKVVLVTGAGGSIGSELCRQVVQFKPSRLVLTDNSEKNLYEIDQEIRTTNPAIPVVSLLCDVRDRRRVNAVLQREHPEVVFHAAAIKHVPIAEENPVEAIKSNLLGTTVVADEAVRAKVRAFVLISTDKAVNPANVMGATKRAAELYCQALDISSTSTNFRIVRFGNVLGSAGSVVPLFQKQIAKGGPVTVTDPGVTRYFMTIPEAVNLILTAVSHGFAGAQTRGSVLVLEMGEPIRIADLARRLIQLAGFQPERDIQIVYTGLRPGEKLKEELFNDTEDHIVQQHEGFVVARTRTVGLDTIRGWIERISDYCAEENPRAAVQLLRTMVPSFVSPDQGPSAEAIEAARKDFAEGETPPHRLN